MTNLSLRYTFFFRSAVNFKLKLFYDMTTTCKQLLFQKQTPFNILTCVSYQKLKTSFIRIKSEMVVWFFMLVSFRLLLYWIVVIHNCYHHYPIMLVETQSNLL